MTIRIATITVEAHSPRRLADFWSALLDYREVSHPTTSIRIDDPAGTGPTILFQPGRTKTHVMKNRIHLDLRPASRDDATERGAATRRSTVRHRPNRRRVVGRARRPRRQRVLHPAIDA